MWQEKASFWAKLNTKKQGYGLGWLVLCVEGWRVECRGLNSFPSSKTYLLGWGTCRNVTSIVRPRRALSHSPSQNN